MDRARFQTLIGFLVIILCMLNAAILGGVVETHMQLEKNARDINKTLDRVSSLEAKLIIVAEQSGVAP